MFERYTERARRVIFFARYEASQLGSLCIETEHLLLGLLREDKELAAKYIGSPFDRADIAQKVRGAQLAGGPLRTADNASEARSMSVDLPLSPDSKRALVYAAEEAERLNHRHIGTEHLLIGLMREDGFRSSQLLSPYTSVVVLRDAAAGNSKPESDTRRTAELIAAALEIAHDPCHKGWAEHNEITELAAEENRLYISYWQSGKSTREARHAATTDIVERILFLRRR